MQIPVNFIEDTTVIEVANNHQHTLETDVEDFTDSSGGFTNEITICRVCGQEWAVRGSERDLDDGRYDWAD
ncbi:MAG TPA: hypothetical protein VMR18_01720 [Candidatus Saccharimonadales bacterium]|nr:hypothetical protein [Candidatus Saccharimonadales bacterium]